MSPKTREILTHAAYWITIVAQLITQFLGNPN